MGNRSPVNSIVRQRLKQLRLHKQLKLKHIAGHTGIPLSSYASMEGGHYGISLDHLHRILSALDADIQDVWPEEKEAIQSAES
jgi:transcriptional regulator with XRE-family HTH domain